jgi:hypothetical protein
MIAYYALWFLGLAFGNLIFGTLGMAIWIYTGEHQSLIIRRKYFAAILK